MGQLIYGWFIWQLATLPAQCLRLGHYVLTTECKLRNERLEPGGQSACQPNRALHHLNGELWSVLKDIWTHLISLHDNHWKHK